MIRMYWWQGGHGTGNFGDKLAPALVQALSGQPVAFAPIEKSELLAIGSCLEPWLWPDESWLTYEGTIWGAGRLQGNSQMRFPRAEIAATRGELTLASLNVPARSEAAVGDPALLCGHLHYAPCRPRYKLGIWPHWSEGKNRELQQIAASSAEIVMIDPCGDVRDTLELAAQCEFIASSALHGLVVADALEIPNCWIRAQSSNKSLLPTFKFLDYFSAFQMPPPLPRVVTAAADLNSLLPQMTSDRHVDAARLRDDLMSSFPYGRVLAI